VGLVVEPGAVRDLAPVDRVGRVDRPHGGREAVRRASRFGVNPTTSVKRCARYVRLTPAVALSSPIARAADRMEVEHHRCRLEAPGEAGCLVGGRLSSLSLRWEDGVMKEEVPARGLQLRSLVTEDLTVEVSLVEVAVPSPGPDEVLVRVEAAPINPSDLAVLFAGADIAAAEVSGTPDRPVVTAPLSADAARAAEARVGQSMPVGNEGAGTVVAAGGSDAAQALLGSVVAVYGGAMYAQYRCVDAAACLALPAGAPAAAGAASFVNPMTVLGMVETMRAEGHTALVHTAAASTLGQMLLRYCREEGVPLVCIVRSREHVELLRGAGAEHVCDSSAESFEEDLTRACAATDATLAFDAIGGGRLAGRILACMEAAITAGAAFARYGSATHKQAYLYGHLDPGPTEIDRSFGMAWGVGGWVLPNFLARAEPEQVARMRSRVADGLSTTFATRFTAEVTLAGAFELDAIRVYGRPATGTKYLITP
jgi:NADPH:quinone reductase